MQLVASGSLDRNYVKDPSPATNIFLVKLRELPANATAIILDVGTNDGAFADSVMARARWVAPHVKTTLLMFEPQARYAARLDDFVAKWNTSRSLERAAVYKAVASHYDGSAILKSSIGTNKMAASTLDTAAFRYGVSKKHMTKRSVPAVDLGRIILDHAAAATYWGPAQADNSSSDVGRGSLYYPLVFLKMDVEGGEYELLPRLLVRGALCVVSVLRVEWHLNFRLPPKRLSGEALRLGLQSMLSTGCTGEREGRSSGPRLPSDVVVEDELYRPLNSGEDVSASDLSKPSPRLPLACA
jgi:hypothetical protein